MPAEISFPGPFEPAVGSDLKAVDLSSQATDPDGTSLFTVQEDFVSAQLFVYLNGLFQGPSGGTEISVQSLSTFTIATMVLPGDSLTVIFSPLNKQ
jgi:hypothetical protein|tara:strand:+ start:4110 stop:4397 length:288 start_codon:yes stop_codon:yes gene_type:complete